MNPDRAPTIVTGTLILRQVLRRYGLPEIRYSERDILDGAAVEAAALPARPEGEAPPGAYTCC
jgi:exopolyphosphatase/pppGpp-phosphohydrolase